MLQVVPGQFIDPAGRTQPEVTLHLLDEVSGVEQCCVLRGDWTQLRVSPGDTVHVTGAFTGTPPTCLVDNAANVISVRQELPYIAQSRCLTDRAGSGAP